MEEIRSVSSSLLLSFQHIRDVNSLAKAIAGNGASHTDLAFDA